MPVFFHFGQDIIAGPVENSVDPFDPVCRCTIPQPLDHRDAPGDGCFIAQRKIACLCGLGQFHPVMGDHRLVGGDKGLAGGQTLARQFQRGAAGAADHFYNAVDILLLGEGLGPVEPGIG